MTEQMDFKLETNYISVYERDTVKFALKKVSKAVDEEAIYYAYVVDDYGVLRGVLPLRSLLATDGDKKVGDVMIRKITIVNAKMADDEIFDIFRKSKLLSLPVVDDAYRLKGTVTMNNALDVIEREKSEDMLKSQGVDIDVFDKSIVKRVRTKIPWLVTTIISGIIMGLIVEHYSPALKRLLPLAFFIPLITAMGESVAGQASAITMEGLIMGKIKEKKFFPVLVGQVLEGAIISLLLGLAVCLLSIFWLKDILVAMVVGLTILAAILIATINGTLGPIALKKIGADPAVSTNPMVFALTDIMVLVFYFSAAIYALNNFRV